jgi:hypothetical protein
MKTYNELLTALIAHYEKCIEELPEEMYEVTRYIRVNKVGNGICFAASRLYDIEIHGTPFVDNFTGNMEYLYKIPFDCHTLDSTRECLQVRVDRMKELLPKWGELEIVKL